MLIYIYTICLVLAGICWLKAREAQKQSSQSVIKYKFGSVCCCFVIIASAVISPFFKDDHREYAINLQQRFTQVSMQALGKELSSQCPQRAKVLVLHGFHSTLAKGKLDLHLKYLQQGLGDNIVIEKVMALPDPSKKFTAPDSAMRHINAMIADNDYVDIVIILGPLPMAIPGQDEQLVLFQNRESESDGAGLVKRPLLALKASNVRGFKKHFENNRLHVVLSSKRTRNDSDPLAGDDKEFFDKHFLLNTADNCKRH